MKGSVLVLTNMLQIVQQFWILRRLRELIGVRQARTFTSERSAWTDPPGSQRVKLTTTTGIEPHGYDKATQITALVGGSTYEMNWIVLRRPSFCRQDWELLEVACVRPSRTIRFRQKVSLNCPTWCRPEIMWMETHCYDVPRTIQDAMSSKCGRIHQGRRHGSCELVGAL